MHNSEKYKYNIKEMLDQMPSGKRNSATKLIIESLGIDRSTFSVWTNMKIDSQTGIPQKKLEKLCGLFSCTPGQMVNYQITGPSIDELLQSNS